MTDIRDIRNEVSTYCAGYNFDIDGIMDEITRDRDGITGIDDIDDFDGILQRHAIPEDKALDLDGNVIDFEAACNVMDCDLREEISMELAPCSNQTFLVAYAEAHERKFGEEFAPYTGVAW